MTRQYRECSFGGPSLCLRWGGGFLGLLFLACGGGGGSSALSRPTPNFSLLTSPASLSLPAGTIGGVTVTLTRVSGFHGAVTLDIPSAPSGVTFSGTIPAGAGSGTLNLQVDGSVAPQTFSNLQIVGTSGILSHGTPFTLTILAALPPGQIRADQVQAGGGTQGSATWGNHALTQEPVRGQASTSGTTTVQHGFYPKGSPQQ